MPDYSKGKIYTIRCRNDPSQIYVGSTIQPLSKRFGTHKKDKMKFPHYPLYKQVEDWSDWYIELYEDFPCERKEQLEKREGEIIRTIATLNKDIAGRKYQEYYTENKEKIDFQQKQYREENKDLRNEKQKEYYNSKREDILEKHSQKNKCICGCEYTKYHKSRHEQSKTHLNFLKLKEDQET